MTKPIENLLPDVRLPHVAATCTETGAAFNVITEDTFATARAEITSWQGYEPTPLVSLSGIAAHIDVADIHYKDEGPRFGIASFKALGGAYAALRVLQQEISSATGEAVSLADVRNGKYASACAGITLVSATDGNHGRSLSWGCQRFGAPCRIFIHSEVSEGRAEVMRGFGAEVVRIDGDYDESVRMAKDEADKHGWFVVSDTSWPGYTDPPTDVMAGYGVRTDEIHAGLSQAPASLRQIWQDQSPRVVVVEPELAPCLFESASAGKMTTVSIDDETIMAGLSCGEPSPIAWNILSDEGQDYLTIPDMLVAPTVRMLARAVAGDRPIESGESAVAGLAALIVARQDAALSEKLALDSASRVLLIGSEGVTDQDIFDKIMAEEI